MNLDSERITGASRREGTTSQEDGRLVTAVDRGLDIVVGVFRDDTKVVDGAIEVSIHRQVLVGCITIS